MDRADARKVLRPDRNYWRADLVKSVESCVNLIVIRLPLLISLLLLLPMATPAATDKAADGGGVIDSSASTPAFDNTSTDEESLAAIAGLEADIENLTKRDGPFADSLFEPLMRLAELQLEFGTIEDAADTLSRAQNITHRNDGVYSLRQLPIIEIMSDLALSQSEHDDANRLARFKWFVSTHALTEDDPARLAAYVELAEWYMYSGQTRRARKLLAEASELAEQVRQDNLPLLLLANLSRRLEGLCCSIRRLSPGLENLPDSSAEVQHAYYLELADTLTLGGKDREAAEYFQKAHAISPLPDSEPIPLTIYRRLENPRSAETAYKVRRDPFQPRRLEKMTPREQVDFQFQAPQWFLMEAEGRHLGFSRRDLNETMDTDKRTQSLIGQPIAFSEEQLDYLLPGRLKRDKSELRIELSFTVEASGDLDNIEVVASNAPLKLNRLMTRALRKVNFRPALLDGVPVARDNVTMVQTFLPRP